MSSADSSSLRKLNLGIQAAGLGFSLVLVYATWTFAIEPLQRQHDELAKRTKSESQLKAREDVIRSEHRELDARVADFEAEFAHAISRIPETPRESEFLAQITHLARTCRLQIHRYHPRDPVNEGTHTALEVQLDASAEYAGICQFLDGLRTLPRLCRVTRLRVHNLSADGASLSIEMTLRIYYAPLNKDVVAEAQHE